MAGDQLVVIFSLIVATGVIIAIKANIEYWRARKKGEIDKEEEDDEMRIWQRDNIPSI